MQSETASTANTVPTWIVTWYPALIPAVFAVFAIIVKFISRRDGDASPYRNDCYLSSDLILGSMASTATYQIKSMLDAPVAAAVPLFLWLITLFILLLTVACIDRFHSWEDRDGEQYRRWGTLILLNAMGMVVFVLTFMFAKRLGVSL